MEAQRTANKSITVADKSKIGTSAKSQVGPPKHLLAHTVTGMGDPDILRRVARSTHTHPDWNKAKCTDDTKIIDDTNVRDTQSFPIEWIHLTFVPKATLPIQWVSWSPEKLRGLC